MNPEEEFFEDARRQIGYDPLQMIWHQQTVLDRDIHHWGSDYINHLWIDIDYQTARRIFELIKDGKKYIIQAVRFKQRGFPLAEWHEPTTEMGYRGYITEVQMLRYQMYEPHEMKFILADTPHAWGVILDDIKYRLRKDITIPKIVKLFYKQVIARILYLPDVNPEHWRI